MEIPAPLVHTMESALLAFIAVYYTLHISSMMRHAHQKIQKLLKVEAGKKCSKMATIAVFAFMAVMGCVAIAPAVHAGIGAITLALG